MDIIDLKFKQHDYDAIVNLANGIKAAAIKFLSKEGYLYSSYSYILRDSNITVKGYVDRTPWTITSVWTKRGIAFDKDLMFDITGGKEKSVTLEEIAAKLNDVSPNSKSMPNDISPAYVRFLNELCDALHLTEKEITETNESRRRNFDNKAISFINESVKVNESANPAMRAFAHGLNIIMDIIKKDVKKRYLNGGNVSIMSMTPAPSPIALSNIHKTVSNSFRAIENATLEGTDIEVSCKKNTYDVVVTLTDHVNDITMLINLSNFSILFDYTKAASQDNIDNFLKSIDAFCMSQLAK